MKTSGYKFFDHTADIAIHIWAENFENLFSIAGKGVIKAIFTNFRKKSGILKTVKLSSFSQETLLTGFLSEINYLAVNNQLVFVQITNIKILNDADDLSLIADCIFYDNKELKFYPQKEVKAITLSNFEIIYTNNKCECRIIFDI
ncbi:MAG: archease [Ignavibacteriaceae bacterium]|nr:archease [Ignavibacteriaceae bacterium]